MKRASRRWLALALVLAACTKPSPEPRRPFPPPGPPPPPAPVVAPAAPPRFDAVPRLAFNRVAADLDLPLFWANDGNGNGAVDPEELATLWGVWATAPAWTQGSSFAPAFLDVYPTLARVAATGVDVSRLAADEQRRRRAVLAELAQGRPSLVANDFRNAPAEDRAIVDHVLRAAVVIERIFARQRGTLGMEARIAADDTASRMLFFRNQGPWCERPKTERDPDCSAVPGLPPKVVGLYPPELQKDPQFCKALEARKDQDKLLSPFTVVVAKGADLETVPFHVAYKADMDDVAKELDLAAAAVASPGEAKLKAYLAAAARAFRDNEWGPADEAWAQMSVDNSKWYLRIGPDEVYTDPCSRKAGFHVSFALINRDSLKWQRMLDPLKADMEGALAKLAGKPYKARKVTFHLPDFIDIVLNAGDSRSAVGGTIGQSLPNWGPVANEGRGRTVAMTNLYTDKDSEQAFLDGTKALFCKGTQADVAFAPDLVVMSTVLHEAAHNLGPAHEYAVDGKKDAAIFGGPLASTLEELKAQTSALFFVDWLAGKKLVDERTALRSHIRDIAWCFGHIASGMYAADGSPKPYSQLASIQVGTFLKAGAVEWKAAETAPNGSDKGCFEVHGDKLAASIRALEEEVLHVKARGDKAAAKKLVADLVDKDDEWKRLRGVIQERWLRAPSASFVYSVRR